MKKIKFKITILITLLAISILLGSCVSAGTIKLFNESGNTSSLAGTIQGTVKSLRTEERLAGAYIYLLGGYVNLEDFDIRLVLDSETTTANGEYIFNDVPEGRFTIIVFRNAFGEDQGKFLPSIQFVTMEPGETIVQNFYLISLTSHRLVNILPETNIMIRLQALFYTFFSHLFYFI
jgi:hypothetical protein